MKVIQSGVFSRQIKKLHNNEKKALDAAIRSIMEPPDAGAPKVGDLAGIRVVKFKLSDKPFLLGYRYDEAIDTPCLLALGSHENFYRDLKRHKP